MAAKTIHVNVGVEVNNTEKCYKTSTAQKRVARDYQIAYPVYKTNDLTIFRDSGLNRPLHRNDQLKNSILERSFDLYIPIIVSPDFFLIDGHNRIAICEEICRENGYDIHNMPFSIPFIIKENVNKLEDEIGNYNFAQKHWISTDFFGSYCNQDKESYREVLSLMANNTIINGRKEKPMLSVGHTILLYTHNLVTTASPLYKSGKLPMGDVDFCNFVCDFIRSRKIQNYGKTELIRALCEWFTYYYPLLTSAQRAEFDRYIYLYDTKQEAKEHITCFCRAIGFRKNDSRVGELKREAMRMFRETQTIPTFEHQFVF